MATNTTSTSQTHNGNGSTATFAISFSFLENTEVDVTVGGVLKTLGTHYNISGSSVTFTSGNIPPSGTNNIKFQRDTDISAKKVDFADGSVLTETDLDNNSDQILFAQQEITDKLGGIEEGATGDQTAAEIRTLVEAATDSNVFTDADHTKLNGIEAAATGDQTDAEIRTAVENANDSNVFTDADHSKLDGIEAGATGDQTNAEIRAAVEAASDSNVFTDADHTKLNGIEDNATADQTVTEIKSLIAGSPLDASHLAANSVTTSEIADAELVTLAGMQSGTASKLADSTALTADIADLNQIDGMQKATTITDDDTKFPTSGAIVDYVAAQLAPIGGLEAIANESSFPNTQPASGVVISIADAGGMAVSSTGTASGATLDGTTVNISGIATNFRGTSVTAGVRFLVVSTGAGQNYTYHKATLREDDLLSLSGDINDFAERYRVGSSNPTTSLDNGDLFFNTSTGKMLVYNGTNTAWEEVQSIGNFFISTLSPAFDGSTQNFTVSDAPTNAQQILLIIEGVVQKPNAGTSTPTEGFALDGSTVKLAAAPATGASYHAVVMGSTVNIGTPSNNTVSSSILQNSSVIEAKIATDAVTTTKIANSAVTEAKIATDAVTTTKIADDAVTTQKIANSAVTVNELGAGAVTNAKLASSSVGAGNLQSNAVETAKIQDDAITEPKIADNAVTRSQIVDGAINGAKCENASIGAEKLTAGTIVDNNLSATANIAGSKLADDSISLAKLEHGTSSNDGKFLRANNGADPTFETITIPQAFVSGMILLWSGAANAIPSGFVLCDGTNSTPDLRDRFVVGAGNSYAVGATGGATTDSITVSVSGTTGGPSSPYSTSVGTASPKHASNTHTHSFSGSGSATVDTLPPYYALCYIMKT